LEFCDKLKTVAQETRDMKLISDQKLTIIRTERGKSIAGTRITLDDVIHYLKANYTPERIAEKLGLTIEQIECAIAYIAEHQAQVEAEYQTGLETAREIRQYWDDHNRDRIAKISTMPTTPEQAELRAKLSAWNDRIEASV
jgi:uncharacterized protein (DUF433 family)